MKLTAKQLKRIIQEEVKKAAPFGSGMEQADLDNDQKDIVGHTWLTHAKLKSSTLQEAFGIRGNKVGKVIWHSLMSDGTITQYDIKFGEKLVRNIPASLVESIEETQHEHASRPGRKIRD